jgi:hypothetical protein
MKIRVLRLAGICFIAVLMLGCAKQLTKDLQQGVYPIDYMLDSKVCGQKTPITIRLNTVSYSTEFKEFKDASIAKTKYWYFVPLVFINFGGSGYNCELGKASIDKNIVEFVKKSYAKEASRSGCFQFVDSGNADYDLDVTILSHETKGPYSTYFYMYFALYLYGYGYGQTAGPGKSKAVIGISLRRKDGSVFERQFENETSTEMLRNKNNVNELKRNYVTGMVESLSMAFKDCIEKSVLAINEQISKKQPSYGKTPSIEQHDENEVIDSK